MDAMFSWVVVAVGAGETLPICSYRCGDLLLSFWIGCCFTLAFGQFHRNVPWVTFYEKLFKPFRSVNKMATRTINGKTLKTSQNESLKELERETDRLSCEKAISQCCRGWERKNGPKRKDAQFQSSSKSVLWFYRYCTVLSPGQHRGVTNVVQWFYQACTVTGQYGYSRVLMLTEVAREGI